MPRHEHVRTKVPQVWGAVVVTEIVVSQASRDAVTRRLYLQLDHASCRTNWEYEAKQILEPVFEAHRQAAIEECAKAVCIACEMGIPKNSRGLHEHADNTTERCKGDPILALKDSPNGLLERLRRTERVSGGVVHSGAKMTRKDLWRDKPVNPDGPEAADTIAELLVRIAALSEALEPFAAIADDAGLRDHADSYAPRPSRGRPCMGDYRLARSLLATPSQGTDNGK